MSKLSRYNPVAGFGDFWTEFRKPTPYRWPILGVSMLITYAMLHQFLADSVTIPQRPPNVIYITSYAQGRDDEQILASNIENQKNQDAVNALKAQGEERGRDMYRTLGKVSGMDVKAIEQKAARERAAEQAAEEARKAEILRRSGLPADATVADLKALARKDDARGRAVASPSQ